MMKRLDFAKNDARALTNDMLRNFSKKNHQQLTGHWGAQRPLYALSEKSKIIKAIDAKFSLTNHQDGNTVLWFASKHHSGGNDTRSLCHYSELDVEFGDEEAEDEDDMRGFEEVCNGYGEDPSNVSADEEDEEEEEEEEEEDDDDDDD